MLFSCFYIVIVPLFISFIDNSNLLSLYWVPILALGLLLVISMCCLHSHSGHLLIDWFWRQSPVAQADLKWARWLRLASNFLICPPPPLNFWAFWYILLWMASMFIYSLICVGIHSEVSLSFVLIFGPKVQCLPHKWHVILFNSWITPSVRDSLNLRSSQYSISINPIALLLLWRSHLLWLSILVIVQRLFSPVMSVPNISWELCIDGFTYSISF